jgi:hypothetical protein
MKCRRTDLHKIGASTSMALSDAGTRGSRAVQHGLAGTTNHVRGTTILRRPGSIKLWIFLIIWRQAHRFMATRDTTRKTAPRSVPQVYPPL